MRNQIILSVWSGLWRAEYLGPHAGPVTALFGSAKLPTAWGSTVDSETVRREISRLNPGAAVTLESELPATAPRSGLGVMSAGYVLSEADARRIEILRAHGIGHRYFKGKLQAEGIYSRTRNGRTRAGREWVTVGGMTRSALYNWLGY